MEPVSDASFVWPAPVALALFPQIRAPAPGRGSKTRRNQAGFRRSKPIPTKDLANQPQTSTARMTSGPDGLSEKGQASHRLGTTSGVASPGHEQWSSDVVERETEGFELHPPISVESVHSGIGFFGLEKRRRKRFRRTFGRNRPQSGDNRFAEERWCLAADRGQITKCKSQQREQELEMTRRARPVAPTVRCGPPCRGSRLGIGSR